MLPGHALLMVTTKLHVEKREYMMPWDLCSELIDILLFRPISYWAQVMKQSPTSMGKESHPAQKKGHLLNYHLLLLVIHYFLNLHYCIKGQYFGTFFVIVHPGFRSLKSLCIQVYKILFLRISATDAFFLQILSDIASLFCY